MRISAISHFLIDKLIICQDIRKKYSLLYYLYNALTRSLFLFFSTIIVNKLKTKVLLIES